MEEKVRDYREHCYMYTTQEDLIGFVQNIIHFNLYEAVLTENSSRTSTLTFQLLTCINYGFKLNTQITCVTFNDLIQ